VNVELKCQRRPSQSREESILNCLLIGSGGFRYKSKGGIGSTKYRTTQKRVKCWREITVAGVKAAQPV